jgi:hypothetical protein
MPGMPAINLSLEHGRSLDDARDCLRAAVRQTTGRFAALVRRTDWAADGRSVRVAGVGFAVDMRVDATHVHLSGDLPGLGGLLGGPVAAGLKQIVQRVFQKRLGGV